MRLQRIETDVPAEIAPLFLTVDDDLTGSRSWRIENGRCLVDAGSTCSFDSYFSSFWENYWFTFTALKSVSLVARLYGKGVIRVMRRTPQLDDYLVAEAAFDCPESAPVTLRIEVNDDADFRGQAGRLWMELVAEEQVCLIDAGWYTDQTPERDVALNVVFTTINRVPYLSRVLQALDADPDALEAIAQVTIVNQGEELSIDDLLPSRAPESTLGEKLAIVLQPNLGGSGGFTRGMLMTLDDPSLSHVLLLDDDIRVHTDSLARASRFLAFAKEDVALGGHMLNLHRPLMVYEAGAQLDPITTKPDPCDLGSPATTSNDLDVFLPVRTVAFNGWWFFGTSCEQLSRAGLPLPCFIRGDDVEFGVRLREFGERTISVPGIAVWHEPFYLKLGGWQYYFETRNRLELASIHGVGNWAGIKRNLFATFVRDIAMARYHSVLFMITALEDYLAGPDVAIDTSDAALRRCRAIADEFGPTRVAETMPTVTVPETLVQRIEGRLPASDSVARVHTAVASLTRLVRVRRLDEVPTFDNATLEPHVVAELDEYRVQEEFGNGVWLYRRRPKLERTLWKRAIRAIVQVRPLPSYREAFESTERWRHWWVDEFARVDEKMSSSAEVA